MNAEQLGSLIARSGGAGFGAPKVAPPSFKRAALLASLCLAVLGSVLAVTTWQRVRQAHLAELKTALHTNKHALDLYFGKLEVALRSLAQQTAPVVSGPDRAERLDQSLMNWARQGLKGFKQLHPEVLSVELLSLTGTIVASSESVDLAMIRPYRNESFQAAARQLVATKAQFDVGRPFRSSVTGQWVVPLRHLMFDPGGEAVALVSATLPVNFIHAFWDEAPILDAITVGVLRDDGYLITRHSALESGRPEEDHGQECTGAVRQFLASHPGAEEGELEGPHQAVSEKGEPGANYLNAFSRLERYPLTLFAASPMSHVYGLSLEAIAPVMLVIVIGQVAIWMGYRRATRLQREWDLHEAQSMEQLRRSEIRFRMLFEHNLEAVLQATDDGQILAANLAAQRLFRADEARLKSLGRGGITMPEDPDLMAMVKRRQAEGYTFGRLRLKRADGSEFEAEVSSSIFMDDAGQKVCATVVRDLTDQLRLRQAEVERLAAERDKLAAEQASLAKSQFIAQMSHELRTPLNAILGFSSVLQVKLDAQRQASELRMLGHIQVAGNHLLALITDLIDLARIEAGRMKIQLECVDLTELMRACVRQIEPFAERHGVQVFLDVFSPEWEPWVNADKTRTSQILLNLLSNAIKYNRKSGYVYVSLHKDTVIDDVFGCHRQMWRLSVRDEGAGLQASEVEQLFQPFNRLGYEESAVEGLGIGLTISQQLVKRMGGRIDIQSVVGSGSTFSIILPACDPPLGAEQAAVLQQQARSVMHLDVVDQRPLKVIYVEDDPVNRMLLEAMIDRYPGVNLTMAESGIAGLPLIEQGDFDLALIDLMMPGMGGIELVQRLKDLPKRAGMRCVALSANAMNEDIEQALAAGFDDYIVKPLSNERLSQAIACCRAMKVSSLD